MGILKELWFWLSVVGVLYVAFAGWTSRYVGRKGQLRSRRNYKSRESTVIVITAVVFVVLYAETFWRASSGKSSVVFNVFTEDIFYELLLFSVFFFAGYACLLFAVDIVAEMLHIGHYQLRKEAQARERAEEEAAWARQKELEKKEFERKILLGLARSNRN